MSRKRTPIDWDTCDPSLIERFEAVLADLVAKQRQIDGEAPSKLTLALLDEQAAEMVEQEEADEAVESQITDAMFECRYG